MLNKKNGKKVVSIVLAVSMGFLAFANEIPGLAADTVNAAADDKYVSEVYTAYGEDQNSAEQVLKDKGFKPVKGNLNQGADTYVMLGYKTTNDPKEAIHDLALMSSQGGFSVGDYENILKERKNEIAQSMKSFMTMVKEFRANYEKKDGKAVVAYTMLNNYIDDDSGKKMGDLLLEDTLQDVVGIEESIENDNEGKLPDLVTIFMQGNGMHINNIKGIVGSATDSRDDDLVERTAETTEQDLREQAQAKKPDLSEAKIEQYIRGQYDTVAKGLAKEAEALAKDLKEYENGDLKLENATEKKLNDEFDTDGKIETAEDLKNATERLEWESNAATYEALKNYEGGKFEKGELLDLIMNADKDNPEEFYTMAASLTKGQKAAKTNVSLRNMLVEAVADEDAGKKVAKKESEDIKEIEDVSIYDGVNREVYKTDGSVAMTDEAIRSNAIAMPVDNTGEFFKTALAFSAGFSIIATGYCLFSYMDKLDKAKEYLDIYVDGYRPQIYGRMMLDDTLKNIKVMRADELLHQYGSMENAYYEITKTSTVEGGAAEFYSDMYENAKAFDKKYNSFTNSGGIIFLKYATIALALISAGVTVAALIYKKESELPPVPKYMVHVSQDKEGKKHSMTYVAAESNGLEYISEKKKNKGKAADTKAFEGREWLTIYSTKEETAGKPVRANFIVQEKAEPNSTYTRALHIIGEKGAENLVQSKYMNFSNYQKLKNKGKTVYVFYAEGEDIQGEASVFSNGIAGLLMAAGLGVLVILILAVRRSKRNRNAAG